MSCAFQKVNSLSPICWQIASQMSTSKSGGGLSLMDYTSYVMATWPDISSWLSGIMTYFLILWVFPCLYSPKCLNYALTLHCLIELWAGCAHNSRSCIWSGLRYIPVWFSLWDQALWVSLLAPDHLSRISLFAFKCLGWPFLILAI